MYNYAVKTFVLCPGVERSGTTWLYKYLSSFDNVDFGDMKEYHYFDSLFLKEYEGYVRINKKHDVIYKFYDNDFNYFNYFLKILNNVDLTADFSPGYSALDKKIFEKIKKTFIDLGVNTKCIFLIRDPISRHISATNMRLKRDYETISDFEYNKQLLDNLKDEVFLINSNYENDIKKIQDVFKNNLLIIKYENLFNEQTIKNLCNFLNLDYKTPNFDLKINYTISKNNIFNETMEQLKKHYYEQTNFYNKLML